MSQAPASITVFIPLTIRKRIFDKGQVHDAVMSFAERAAEKVRHAGQVAGAVQLFIRTVLSV